MLSYRALFDFICLIGSRIFMYDGSSRLRIGYHMFAECEEKALSYLELIVAMNNLEWIICFAVFECKPAPIFELTVDMAVNH